MARLFGVLEIDRAHLAARVLLQLVRHAVVLRERTHARTLERRDVYEGVVPAAVRRDKAIALFGIEEFHGTGGHVDSFFLGGRPRCGRPGAVTTKKKKKKNHKTPKTVDMRLKRRRY